MLICCHTPEDALRLVMHCPKAVAMQQLSVALPLQCLSICVVQGVHECAKGCRTSKYQDDPATSLQCEALAAMVRPTWKGLLDVSRVS